MEELLRRRLLVPLAALTDPSTVVPTIAQTLGFREQSALSFAEKLSALLRQPQPLLLLDNFEQLVDAAPSSRARSPRQRPPGPRYQQGAAEDHR